MTPERGGAGRPDDWEFLSFHSRFLILVVFSARLISFWIRVCGVLILYLLFVPFYSHFLSFLSGFSTCCFAFSGND